MQINIIIYLTNINAHSLRFYYQPINLTVY